MSHARRTLVTGLVIAVLGVVSACSYDDSPENPYASMDVAPADCQAIKGYPFVRDTLLPKCAGSACHDPGNTRAVVVLTAATAYQSTVDVPSATLPSMKLVAPGRPSRSFLFRKLSATQAAVCEAEGLSASRCGQQMPLNDWFALPEPWIEETRLWIACGARP